MAIEGLDSLGQLVLKFLLSRLLFLSGLDLEIRLLHRDGLALFFEGDAKIFGLLRFGLEL